jgi:hypothetical protein
MAVKYTNKKAGEDYEIYRDDVHVATYDPTSDDTTYTNGSDKYSGPIGREVVVIQGSFTDPPLTDWKLPSEIPSPPFSKPKETFKLTNKIIELEKLVLSLKKEIVELEARATNSVTKSVNPRYVDKVDLTGAPVTSKYLGDLTLDFIEWARNGGMTEEVFTRRYTGRIKDLTYKG